jgi:hypothetical protein
LVLGGVLFGDVVPCIIDKSRGIPGSGDSGALGGGLRQKPGNPRVFLGGPSNWGELGVCGDAVPFRDWD